MPFQCMKRPFGVEESSDRWHQNNPKPPDMRWLRAHQVGGESPSPSLMRRGTQRCRPSGDQWPNCVDRVVIGYRDPQIGMSPTQGKLMQRLMKSRRKQTPPRSLQRMHGLTSHRDHQRTCQGHCKDPPWAFLASCRRGINKNCPHHLRCRPTSQKQTLYPEKVLTW
jgi:hypothetical protein